MMVFSRSRKKSVVFGYLFLFFVSNFLLWPTTLSLNHKGVNGGINCAACTAVAALTNQLSVIHNETFVKSFDRLCNLLPEPIFKGACISLGNYYIPQIVDLLAKHVTADIICHAIDLCYTDKGQPTCRGFPPRGDFNVILNEARKKISIARAKSKMKVMESDNPKSPHFDPCVLPGVRELCHLLIRVFTSHHPLVDYDNDFFSPFVDAWRGTSWRGRDCDDFDPNVRPGAIDQGDFVLDTNCNGIWGIHDLKTLRTNEEVLCKGIFVAVKHWHFHADIPTKIHNTQWISGILYNNGLRTSVCACLPISKSDKNSLNNTDHVLYSP
jgi:acyloxyacyl hydrolase